MPRLIGEGLLPDSIQSQRLKMRERLMSLREPVRSTREDLVPGPDLIGKAENTFKDFRDRFVTRESILDRIKMRRQDGEGEGDQGNSGTSKKDSSSRTTVN